MSSLLVLSAVGNLGKKGVIMVLHHTDCGLASITDQQIRDALIGGLDVGKRAEGWRVLGNMEFGSVKS
jgi:carbonic anhydrase